MLAQQLAEDRGDSRAKVMYMAAPSESGKSAAVLPAFLRAVELELGLTHYLHMPFYNNDGDHHRGADVLRPPSPGLSLDRLEDAGAEYMLECFRAQAEDLAYNRNWSFPESPQDVTQTKKAMRKAVDTFMDRSPGGVLLVHRRSWPDLPDAPGQGSSSAICRVPLGKPLFDVRQCMEKRPEFQLPATQGRLSQNDRRRLASLKISLGLAPASAPPARHGLALSEQRDIPRWPDCCALCPYDTFSREKEAHRCHMSFG